MPGGAALVYHTSSGTVREVGDPRPHNFRHLSHMGNSPSKAWEIWSRRSLRGVWKWEQVHEPGSFPPPGLFPPVPWNLEIFPVPRHGHGVSGVPLFSFFKYHTLTLPILLSPFHPVWLTIKQHWTLPFIISLWCSHDLPFVVNL